MLLLEDLPYCLCHLELITFPYITSVFHLQNGIIAPNLLGLFEILFLIIIGGKSLRLPVSQTLIGGLLISSLNPQYYLQGRFY